MASQTLINAFDAIEAKITAINQIINDSLPTEQSRVGAVLSDYLVVYVCGVFEETIEILFYEMSTRIGKGELSEFVKSSMKDSFQNPDFDKIRKTIRRFNNNTWDTELTNIPQIHKEAINSISTNKNTFAHGNRSTPLTMADVEVYYRNAKPVLEKIDELLASI